MRILLVYVVCVFVGQALAVGLGLLIDPYSKTAAIAVFIPVYYAMYWVAWRVALFVVERVPGVDDSSGDKSGTPAKVASWLLAPAVLALDFCD